MLTWGDPATPRIAGRPAAEPPRSPDSPARRLGARAQAAGSRIVTNVLQRGLPPSNCWK